MPAGRTYTPIATTTLSTTASNITFSSISGTYTDLKLILVATGDANAAGQAVLTRFNSDTGSNYSVTRLSGNGTSASSGRWSNITSIYTSFDGLSVSIPTVQIIDIFSYAGSTNKTCLISNSENKNGSGYAERRVGLWRNTSAITTIAVLPNSGNFAAGTTATLYGILAA
jgi:hypothetical protein